MGENLRTKSKCLLFKQNNVPLQENQKRVLQLEESISSVNKKLEDAKTIMEKLPSPHPIVLKKYAEVEGAGREKIRNYSTELALLKPNTVIAEALEENLVGKERRYGEYEEATSPTFGASS